jgi:hypothetical protein
MVTATRETKLKSGLKTLRKEASRGDDPFAARSLSMLIRYLQERELPSTSQAVLSFSLSSFFFLRDRVDHHGGCVAQKRERVAESCSQHLGNGKKRETHKGNQQLGLVVSVNHSDPRKKVAVL